MYFNKIRLVGLTNIDLPIENVNPYDTLVLRDASGLGPPDLNVFLDPTLYQNLIFQNRQAQGREIVLRIRMNPDYYSGQTVADIRTILYGLLSPNSTGQIGIQLMNGSTVVVVARGYIKRLEAVPFSKEPEVQLTISCDSAFLEAPATVNVNLAGLSKTAPNFVYDGSAPGGFHLEMTFTTAQTSFTLTSQSDPTQKIKVTTPIAVGDKLTFDTRAGFKNAAILKGAATSSLIHTLSSDSVWPQLTQGNNVFTTSVATFNYTAAYFLPLYWGV